MITTKAELRAVVRQAETAVALLRTPGFRFTGPGERARIAGMLEILANIARRACKMPAPADAVDDDPDEWTQAELDDMGVPR